jgi:hypothetical protein
MGTERPAPSESRARHGLGDDRSGCDVPDLCPALLRETGLFQNQSYSTTCSRLTA